MRTILNIGLVHTGAEVMTGSGGRVTIRTGLAVITATGFGLGAAAGGAVGAAVDTTTGRGGVEGRTGKKRNGRGGAVCGAFGGTVG